MKLFATCTVGLERFLEKELIKAEFSNIFVGVGYCTADTENFNKIISFAYASGISIRSGLYLFESKFDDINKIINDVEINNQEFFELIDKNTSFKVECKRIGNHNFTSVDVERKLGGKMSDLIKEKSRFLPKTDLKKPDLSIYTQIIDNYIVMGLDLLGFDSNNRDYKIFNAQNSIKGDLGCALAMIGTEELKNNSVILDPICNNGVIGIETTHILGCKSINFFRKKEFILRKKEKLNEKTIKIFDETDKKIIPPKTKTICTDPQLNNVMATRKNSKIANLDKFIEITRTNIEDLKFKFEKNSVDSIITHMPPNIKDLNDNKQKLLIEDFFGACNTILKSNSKLVILCKNSFIVEFAEKYNFKLLREFVVGYKKINKIYEFINNN